MYEQWVGLDHDAKFITQWHWWVNKAKCRGRVVVMAGTPSPPTPNFKIVKI
uniref:Uncharacterized protein n=1 Tax=Arundo donax TaxID=35708 RepID=A0A0A9G9J1_ARUDO